MFATAVGQVINATSLVEHQHLLLLLLLVANKLAQHQHQLQLVTLVSLVKIAVFQFASLKLLLIQMFAMVVVHVLHLTNAYVNMDLKVIDVIHHVLSLLQHATQVLLVQIVTFLSVSVFKQMINLSAMDMVTAPHQMFAHVKEDG